MARQRGLLGHETVDADVRLTVRRPRIAGLWSMLENREVEVSLMWDYGWCRIDRADAIVIACLRRA
ncbi:hypothetical protein ACH4U7_46070 [Streptomyces sp. NPDC020845]|uniref:hypothetical protein n=1 Tax=Streptomyces sp. NPDC020845 TaxID=3365096 RepID=UPI00378FD53E